MLRVMSILHSPPSRSILKITVIAVFALVGLVGFKPPTNLDVAVAAGDSSLHGTYAVFTGQLDGIESAAPDVMLEPDPEPGTGVALPHFVSFTVASADTVSLLSRMSAAVRPATRVMLWRARVLGAQGPPAARA